MGRLLPLATHCCASCSGNQTSWTCAEDGAPYSQDYLKKLPLAVKTAPMVVLVNGASAGASEVVAGALQDHQRATIVGVRTFGRGTVQTILPLDRDTAMKLTTGRMFTPSGKSIAAAITPDLIADDTRAGSQVFGTSEDHQLLQATKHLRRDSRG